MYRCTFITFYYTINIFCKLEAPVCLHKADYSVLSVLLLLVHKLNSRWRY